MFIEIATEIIKIQIKENLSDKTEEEESVDALEELNKMYAALEEKSKGRSVIQVSKDHGTPITALDLKAKKMGIIPTQEGKLEVWSLICNYMGD